MKSLRRLVWLALVPALWIGVAVADEVPHALSYQGQLLDSLGDPVTAPTSVRFVLIRGGDSTSVPSAGVPVYREDATIDPDADGLFAHHIGQGTPTGLCDEDGDDVANEPCALGPGDFSDGDTPLFLEVRINPSGADNVLIPRQRLSSVGYAMRAATLNGMTSSQIDAFTPPVGSVISYYGDPADLPDNWMLCDGSTVNDPDSPLNGLAVPDLRDRFTRGETDTARDLPTAGVNTGGSDDEPAHSHSLNSAGSHEHTVDNHRHGLSGTTDTMSLYSGPLSGSYYALDDQQGWGTNVHLRVDGGSSSSEGHHRHDLGGNTGYAQPGTNSMGIHTHSVNSGGASTGGNVPGYVALHRIIRIK